MQAPVVAPCVIRREHRRPRDGPRRWRRAAPACSRTASGNGDTERDLCFCRVTHVATTGGVLQQRLAYGTLPVEASAHGERLSILRRIQSLPQATATVAPVPSSASAARR